MTTRDHRLANHWPARFGATILLFVLGSLRPASAPPAPPPAKPPEMRSVDAKPSPTCSPACPKNQTCCETNTCCTVTVQPAAAKHSDLLTAWPVDVLFIQ